MAAAVMEAVEDGGEAFAEVDVRVVPGLSAMQAAAARVGAPLGHDFCVDLAVGQPQAVGDRRAPAARGRRGRHRRRALQPGLAHAPRAARPRA
jgi:precorrin-3B C17-methyltransferase